MGVVVVMGRPVIPAERGDEPGPLGVSAWPQPRISGERSRIAASRSVRDDEMQPGAAGLSRTP